MPEEAEEDDSEENHGVIYAEVVEVPFYTDGGFAEGVGAGKGGEGEEIAP